jgi:DNA replication protein DnaC
MKRTKLSCDLLKDANIPKQFWKFGRDTYVGDKSALKRVEKYVANFESAYEKGIGLLLKGPTQSCKTFLATYVLKSIMANGTGDQVYYLSTDELFELYISGDSAGENFLSRFRETHCVVIDNVGITDKAKLGKRNALEKVVSFRADQGLPYIICTDLRDQQEIAENYGEKIAHHFNHDLVEVECSCSQELIRAKRQEAKLEFLED